MGKEVSSGLVRLDLLSPGNVILGFQGVGGLMVSAGALGVSGRIVIADILTGTAFQAGVGIQPFLNDVEVASQVAQPSVNIGTTTGLGLKDTVSKNFFSFDPTNASNGDITKAFRFRLGVLFNTKGASNVASRGVVLFEYTVRYA